jgi:hypothetical protein
MNNLNYLQLNADVKNLTLKSPIFHFVTGMTTTNEGQHTNSEWFFSKKWTSLWMHYTTSIRQSRQIWDTIIQVYIYCAGITTIQYK